jgi:hypothetical protein
MHHRTGCFGAEMIPGDGTSFIQDSGQDKPDPLVRAILLDSGLLRERLPLPPEHEEADSGLPPERPQESLNGPEEEVSMETEIGASPAPPAVPTAEEEPFLRHGYVDDPDEYEEEEVEKVEKQPLDLGCPSLPDSLSE